MNVILFRGSCGAARNYKVGPAVLTGLSAMLVILVGAAFGGGYLSANTRSGLEHGVELEALQGGLTEQQQQIARLRGDAREQLDALALRLGEMNANVIRLNALGRRLTGMAKLDDGEFDFDSVPALGGPEEPNLITSEARIPDVIADLDTMSQALNDQQQQLAVLEGLMMNRKLHRRVYPQGRPVRTGYVSSYFGKRVDPFNGKANWHRGVDFAGKAGTHVITVAAGVVSWSGDRYGYGKMIEINHGNGYVTRYAHNDENLVAVGDYVQPGQTIALMGSTGRATGPNLHFEVWYRGQPVNPVKHIRETT